MTLWCKQFAPPTLLLFSHSHSAILHRSKALTTNKVPNPKSSSLPLSTNTTTSTLQTLTPTQKNQISLYVQTLLQWNQRMNLTAVTKESEVMSRHVEDSLALIGPLKRSYMSSCGGFDDDGGVVGFDLNLVDVGSGAGLPGLIFAIACPSELLDS